MSQATRVVDTLKALLRAQDKTYKDVAVTLNLTEAGVKKALNSESLSLSRMEEICALLNISLLDLMQLSRDSNRDKQLVLTREQEEILAGDEELFVAYSLILTMLDPELICGEFNFTRNQLQKSILKLESLGLLTQMSNGQLRLKFEVNPVWLIDGPLLKRYGVALANEFVVETLRTGAGHTRFLRGKMTESSAEVFKNKMQKMEEEFALLCLPPTRNQASQMYGYYHCIRPWSFSVIEKYRREK